MQSRAVAAPARRGPRPFPICFKSVRRDFLHQIPEAGLIRARSHASEP